MKILGALLLSSIALSSVAANTTYTCPSAASIHVFSSSNGLHGGVPQSGWLGQIHYKTQSSQNIWYGATGYGNNEWIADSAHVGKWTMAYYQSSMADMVFSKAETMNMPYNNILICMYRAPNQSQFVFEEYPWTSSDTSHYCRLNGRTFNCHT